MFIGKWHCQMMMAIVLAPAVPAWGPPAAAAAPDTILVGIDLAFSASDHQGLHKVWLTRTDHGVWVPEEVP